MLKRPLPVPNGREAMPDQLRGVALLGIILVNVFCFSFGSFSASRMDGAANLDAKMAVQIFVYGKFFLIFSFLFGYSANFIVGDGAPSRRRIQRRRLAALALLGILHGLFLFAWDILLGYAVLGFVLLGLMRLGSGALIRLAVALAVIFTLGAALFDGVVDARMPSLEPIYAGGFLESFQARIQAYPWVLLDDVITQWGVALASMIAGLVAGRAKLLKDPAAWMGRAWRVLGMVAPVGLGFVVVGALFKSGKLAPSLTEFWSNALFVGVNGAGSFFMAASYVCALGIALGSGYSLPGFVAAAGRCSLTIYLSMSLAMSLLFGKWGLGLYNSLSTPATIAVAFGVWLVLSLAAQWWLRRHDAGPLERLMAAWTKRDQPAAKGQGLP
jgi:uncharacterized protein